MLNNLEKSYVEGKNSSEMLDFYVKYYKKLINNNNNVLTDIVFDKIGINPGNVKILMPTFSQDGEKIILNLIIDFRENLQLVLDNYDFEKIRTHFD